MKDLLIDVRSLRRKLDVEAEIERISAPELRASTLSVKARSQVRSDLLWLDGEKEQAIVWLAKAVEERNRPCVEWDD